MMDQKTPLKRSISPSRVKMCCCGDSDDNHRHRRRHESEEDGCFDCCLCAPCRSWSDPWLSWKSAFFNQMGFQLSVLPPLLRLLLQEGGRAPRSPPPWGEATNITVIITITMSSMATKTTMGLGWHLTSRISFSFRQLVFCWKLWSTCNKHPARSPGFKLIVEMVKISSIMFWRTGKFSPRLPRSNLSRKNLLYFPRPWMRISQDLGQMRMSRQWNMYVVISCWLWTKGKRIKAFFYRIITATMARGRCWLSSSRGTSLTFQR